MAVWIQCCRALTRSDDPEEHRQTLRIGGLRSEIELDRQADVSHHRAGLSNRRLRGLEAEVGRDELHVGCVDHAVVVGVRRRRIAWLSRGRAE